ncbi:MAG: tyrosine--tRNA ligase [Deltaproteobacteria bacterium RIFCSPLOWO2_01_44_7]|nr:MAG: tyrosine--tRNA ligase [Deltaproteobacteria bacterium RIFCSPHIGHO2_01_FULL_43_49]OGQ16290.1 MAG: tyrosine--tRNA ligase [Deltaproteobacteria bacterium RIFCSPHIGHO2_02_FULL_44_53]OGQ29250.1 MAG: tyrosine--tRNA ligase [Deltaproteobacteria bacterium RIFCSPHIGHO2_12_FULL_44_21]OGQ32807.1 MAG: tyrosine--tRNA ligase [Deltaproteobacteria bacterium RIFCSPLOWO2_01_FULL_45_74]OGQ41457.1 MAG: tyrosine--tRNA ligase [Deltaproteobacteria bacterium RIFCSPLOWO2_01_44_7]OGQ41908.1 MAG: tyrosine--tRNA lig
MKSVNEQIEVLSRGAAELISPQELTAKLKKGKPLRVKAGFDPTIADLHLGHTVVMQKLKQFQDLGHQVIFLIGDYTALVGDPSGQIKTRPTLTKKEVEQNAKTYLSQAFKILDKKKIEVRRNSEWLGKMKQDDTVALAAKYNVARMLERDDFKKRHGEGSQITILEFLYPLMQGYDSVVLKADVELGGNDQKFNLAVARDIQRAYGQEPEVILTLPLLVGTDGQKKMSKSYGNYIGITESPKEIFGKILSLTDELMWHYYELLTQENLGELKKIHPKEAKVKLAKELVTRFYSEKEAAKAAEEFEKVFAKKEKPSDIEEKILKKKGEIPLVEILVESGLTTSKSEARRLIQQGGVKLDETRVEDLDKKIEATGVRLLQVGKRKFLKVKFN